MHYVFNSYNWLLPRFTRSTTLRAGLSKSLFDNFVHCPIVYIPTFYIAMGLMQGHEPAAVSEALEREWLNSSMACAAFWTPLEALIFIGVPQHMRLIACNVCNLAWNAF